MSTYQISDSGNTWGDTYEADSAKEAFNDASDDVTWGDYGCEGNKTVWITLWVNKEDKEEDEEEEDYYNGTVAIDPPEPDCVDGNVHDWKTPHDIVGGCKENPGVVGSGGGTKSLEVCMNCGCAKLTDNWATNPSTGEQNLDSVEYTPGYVADQAENDESEYWMEA